MLGTDYGDVIVCTDCYFAHHYGVQVSPDGEAFYVGDDDVPTLTRPLGKLDGYEITDNTDAETGDGIDEFSWSHCQGCGSPLGGPRYRLHLWEVPA